MNILLERRQIEAIALHLREMVGDDDVAYADMLEGETDLHELVRWLLNRIEHDEGVISALVAQIGDRNFRKERAGARIDSYREAIAALLEAARLDKLTLPEATISLRRSAPKLVVADESALPDPLWRVKRTPDMASIRAAWDADGAVPGVTQTIGNEPSLTIRRK